MKKDASSDLNSDQQSLRVVSGKTRQVKPVPAEQLSFLKFAVENAGETADAPKEEDVKERLL